MTSNKPTCVTLFSGGGLSALGARDAGFELVGAVEYCAEIADVYRTNLGPHVTVGKVEEVCPCPYIGIDALLASPVCTRASVANASRGESEVDMAAAEGVCRWLRVCRPQCFVMENVTQYRGFASYRLIMATLYRLGYLCTDDTCNSADYAVAQTRRRMIVRALLGAMPPPLKPTHYNPAAAGEDGGLFAEDTRGRLPWVGWYAAIEDILDTLPESQFAKWQLARLEASVLKNMKIEPNVFVGGANKSESFLQFAIENRASIPGIRNGSQPMNTVPSDPSTTASGRAFLVEGDAAGDRPPTCGTLAEPAFTLKTASGGRVHRAFLCGVQGEGGDLYRDGGTPSPTLTTAHDAAKYRAFLVSDFTEASGKGVGVPNADAPAGTVRAGASGGGPAKGWLEQGRIVSMSPRALARFMSCPDTYTLPASNKLASTVLGNGVPCLLSQRIMEQLKECI